MNHLCFWLGLKDVRESTKFGWTAHYRCISYRPSSVFGKRCGCKAWIKIRHSDGSVDYSPDSHSSCSEASKRARVSDISAPVTEVLDLTAEMLAACKARAVGNTSIPAQVIADTLADEYDAKNVTLC